MSTEVDLFQGQAGAGVKGQHVAHAHGVAGQRRRQADHALVVGPAHGHHAVVLQDFLDGDQFPRLLVAQAGDDDQGFVQQHFLADGQASEVKQRGHTHAQFASALDDIGRLHAGGGDRHAGCGVAALE